MTATAPASTAAANGTSSRARSTSSERVHHRQPEVRVDRRVPVPREVLRARTHPRRLHPRRRTPARAAPPAPATAPNDRTPITGFSGLLFTSTTGARSRSMPTAASSAPTPAATSSVRAYVVDGTERSVARPRGTRRQCAAGSRHRPPRRSRPGRPGRRPAGRPSGDRPAPATRMFDPNNATDPSPASSLASIHARHDRPGEGRHHHSVRHPLQLAHDRRRHRRSPRPRAARRTAGPGRPAGGAR